MAASNEAVKAASFISRLLAASALRGIPVEGLNFGPARAGGREFILSANKNPSSTMGAIQKLADAKVSEPIDFDAGIVYVPGDAQNNSMLSGTPEQLEAFIRQTQEEHDQALDQFMDPVKYPQLAGKPELAARKGIRAEERLNKWWNDHDPRVPLTPSSSCVKRARIGSNGDIYVVFGSNPNKEYQYEGSSDPVEASRILAELVGEPGKSIGRKVNSWSGSWGQAHTYLPKEKKSKA